VAPPSAEPSPPACPKAGPFAVPAKIAGSVVEGAPAQGAYSYRVEGSVKQDDAAGQALPDRQVRMVRNIKRESETRHTFDVSVPQPGATDTTTYRVDQSTGNSELDGLFIVSQTRAFADGRPPQQFNPTPPVRIFRTPTESGARFTSSGTDPLVRTNMTIQGVVEKKDTVDACGEVLDAWLVSVSGRILSPERDTAVSATFHIAPQFGALIIAEGVTLKTTAGSTTTTHTSKAVINSITPAPLPADASTPATSGSAS
jgi:hypothetical protein